MEECKVACKSVGGYGKPPWRFKGRAVYQLHLVKSQVARALIPKDFRLVEAFGYTLGGFFLANYDDSPAGAFDELVVIAGIVWNPPTSCAWASKVLVNSNEACLHGRTDVGLPSHVATFTKFRCSPEQLTVNKGQQESRFRRCLSKIGLGSTMPIPKFDLETEVTELNGSAPTAEMFRISLLSSLPKENPKAWLGPHIKMSLPSFSGRTEYHASLLKYSCQMECRVRLVHPLKISRPSAATDLRTSQRTAKDQKSSFVHQDMDENVASTSTLSLAVMLSKPVMALEFDCMSMNVEAPLIISEQNITNAAMRACRDAITSNSIPAFRRGSIPGVSFEQMKLQIKLGVPHSLQQSLDIEKVKSVFPYGKILDVEVVDGGLICSSGVLVEEMGDKNNTYIVNAAVYVGY